MRSTHSWRKGVVLGRGSPWAEARRPEIPGLPHIAEVDLGMKTVEGPAKEFELDSGVANREPWKFPKGSDILGWALLDRVSISLLPLFRQRTSRRSASFSFAFPQVTGILFSPCCLSPLPAASGFHDPLGLNGPLEPTVVTALKLAYVASCELAPWCWNPSSSRVPRVLTDFPRRRSAVDTGGSLSH